MITKSSKCLVIDASVARSVGGEDATYPASVACRDFLKAVIDNNHKVVMTPEIKKEWDKHQSRFAQSWKTTMIAKKKFIYYREIPFQQELWNQIETVIESDNNRVAMFKDFHLIEAALISDKIIISLDETVRKLFSTAATSVKELKIIVWINPTREEEKAISWLQESLSPEINRNLGTF